MYTELPDILPPVAPLNGDNFGYTFPVDVSPEFAEFAEQLKERGQCYLELSDGSMIPVEAVPVRGDQEEAPAVITVPISFTSNSAL